MLGKTVTMPMPIPQRQRQDVFYCPVGYQSEYTLLHTTRVIKYVFLDGSQNIAPSPHTSPSFQPHLDYLESYPRELPDRSLANSYWVPDLERLPIFVTLSKSQEKLSSGWGQPLCSRDRLPVFRQLCGEGAVPASRRQEDVGGPKPAEGESEDSEVIDGQGLREELSREEEEGEESESCGPALTAIQGREAKP